MPLLTFFALPLNRSFLFDVGYEFVDVTVASFEPAHDVLKVAQVANGHKSYVETLHSTSKSYANDRATVDAYMWVELNDVIDDIEFISVVDDVGGVIDENSVSTLRSRADSVVRWSEREYLVEKLTA